MMARTSESRMLGQDHTEMEKTMITRRSLLSGTAAAGLGMSGLGFAQTQSHGPVLS